MRTLIIPALVTACLLPGIGAAAQTPLLDAARATIQERVAADSVAIDTVPELPAVSVSDSLLTVYGAADDYDPFDMPLTLPRVFFMPAVYDTYHFDKPLTVGEDLYSGRPEMKWIEEYEVLSRQMGDINRNLFTNHPEVVKYILSELPEAPKQYTAVINPSDFTISVGELATPADVPTLTAEEVKKRHWIRAFSASLQFSQAYVSPNWYQGGNNNLNALANIFYNVKLNKEYHPNLLFETTVQYKLGINNAPDDSIHAYNVSEDVLQINTTFGLKAANRWYYSLNGQFKTQVLNSYKSNTRDLTSAFLSPGELTVGAGMTYNYVNKSKTFTFDASIAPLSYNLVTCINNRIDPGTYDIEPGRHTRSNFGSSIDLKATWQISYNIRYTGHVFAFTNYDAIQVDWENTLAFEINRFLTTQIYAHLRYDTRTPHNPDPHWHKLQVKEIFSIGFAYKFSSL